MYSYRLFKYVLFVVFMNVTNNVYSNDVNVLDIQGANLSMSLQEMKKIPRCKKSRITEFNDFYIKCNISKTDVMYANFDYQNMPIDIVWYKHFLKQPNWETFDAKSIKKYGPPSSSGRNIKGKGELDMTRCWGDSCYKRQGYAGSKRYGSTLYAKYENFYVYKQGLKYMFTYTLTNHDRDKKYREDSKHFEPNYEVKSAKKGTLKRMSWGDNLKDKTYHFSCNNESFIVSDRGKNAMQVQGLGRCSDYYPNSTIESAASKACDCFVN